MVDASTTGLTWSLSTRQYPSGPPIAECINNLAPTPIDLSTTTSNNVIPVATDLQVEYDQRPLNISPEAPRFSWLVEGPERGARQTAYRIIVGRTRGAVEDGRGELWDTG